MSFIGKTGHFLGLSALRKFVSDSMAIDMGSASTLIAVRGRGVVVDEPSVVAVNKLTGEVIAFGNEAHKMQGREARDVTVIAPLVDGVVIGVDLADPPLARARAKATAQGLTNVEFRRADVEHTGFAAETFDAVVCVFGIFFLPDMAAGVRELWRLVRPGGRLAVTIWGPRLFEPGTGVFWDAVEAERPDLVRGYQPWTRMTSPEELARLLAAGGAHDPTVEAESGVQPLTAELRAANLL